MNFSSYFPKMLAGLLLMQLVSSGGPSEGAEYETYIIHMDQSHKPESFLTLESWHRYILASLSKPEDDQKNFMYSYNHVMHGFSARLTQCQLAEIEKSPAHIATYHESSAKLLTTYSPKFLGLNNENGAWPNSSYGKGVIIGIIDTGIWPESGSFYDEGMPPVPQRWKGQCETGTGFSPSSCNRKLIGARSFYKGLEAAAMKFSPHYQYDKLPRDHDGHGTHTSSTATGSQVLGVSHFGYAKGTARGMAPRAHVAMYKVQFQPYESYVSDVLAAMDQAVSDGVDILSLSLGIDLAPYYDDVIAIASLSAIGKGVLVVCAAGNDGPSNGSISNGAPWITTVGASTIGRSFTASLVLDNGMTIEGTSYYPQSVYISDAELYYGQHNETKAKCYRGALDRSEVSGKVVVCDGPEADGTKEELKMIGAFAGIIITDMSDMDPDDYSFPTVVLSTSSGALLKNYMVGTVTAKLKSLKFVNTSLNTRPAPQIADFSSRGPDPINPATLKPDIIAPGVDILAAVTPRPYVKLGQYNVVTDYSLMSGTSMAAPHVAGVAALLKSLHPEWSPAAIRSAIVTTASTRDNIGAILKDQSTGASATPLEFGAGHINPNKAIDPGLIYDANFEDYVNFLCGLNYTAKQMHSILRRNQWNCSSYSTDLNYPSFTGRFDAKSNFPMVKTFSRVVTNVGNDISTYHASLEIDPLGSSSGMTIKVKPTTLHFTEKYQKQGFAVTLSMNEKGSNVAYGFLKWSDEHNHEVSSPIVALR